MSLFDRVFPSFRTGADQTTRPVEVARNKPSLRVRLAPFVVYTNVMFVMLGLGAIAPVLPEIQKDFDVSYATIALVISAFAVGRLFTNLPAGYAVGRISPVYLLMFGASAVAAGSIVAATADSMSVLLIGRVLSGIGSSITTTVGLTIVLGNAPADKRGRAGALFHSSIGGGALLGPGFGALISTLGDWRTVLIGAAAAAILSFVLILLVAGPAARAWSNVARAPGRMSDTSAGTPSNGRVLVLTGIFVAAFAIFFQRGAMRQTLVPLIAQDAAGLSTPTIGVLLMLAAAATIVIGPWVGGLTDRIGRSRILVPGLLLLALGSLFIGFSENVYVWVLGLIITSIGGTVSSIPSSMIADTVSASARGTAIGSYRVAGDGALVIAPIVAGELSDSSGFAAAGIATAILVVVAALLIFGVNLRTRRN